MILLPESLKSWNTPEFDATLRNEVRSLGANHLPLQEGLTVGGYALDENLDAKILRAAADDAFIRVRVGIFYSSIIAGCSCADDPTPINENSEYCEADIAIDRQTAEARINIARD